MKKTTLKKNNKKAVTLDGLAVKVDGLTGTVDKLSLKTNSLSTTVDKLAVKVDDLTGTVDKLAVKVDKIAVKVDDLTDNLDNLATTVENLAIMTAQGLFDVNKRLEKFEEETAKNFVTVRRDILSTNDRFVMQDTYFKKISLIETRLDNHDDRITKIMNKAGKNIK
jgi:ABC-type transporter Mla subunit MlaD